MVCLIIDKIKLQHYFQHSVCTENVFASSVGLIGWGSDQLFEMASWITSVILKQQLVEHLIT